MKPEDERELVHTYAQEWGRWCNSDTFPFTWDHCINGTRVAIDALARFGIVAEPLSVRMMVFNDFAWQLFEQHVPTDEWPTHAWSIGVGMEGQDLHAAGRDPQRWPGHLICEGGGWTMDVSAMQFHRQGRIDVPAPWVADEWVPWGADEWAVWSPFPRQVWLVQRAPENEMWKKASGWTNPQNQEAATRMLRVLERRGFTLP